MFDAGRINNPSEVTTDDSHATSSQQSHDTQLLSYDELAEKLNQKPDTLRTWWRRYLGKMYENCPTPLRTAVNKTSNGNPIYGITAFGVKAYEAFATAKDRDGHVAAVTNRYGSQPSKQTEQVDAEIVDFAEAIKPSGSGIVVASRQVNYYRNTDLSADLEAIGEIMVNPLEAQSGSMATLADLYAQVGRQQAVQLFAIKERALAHTLQQLETAKVNNLVVD